VRLSSKIRKIRYAGAGLLLLAVAGGPVTARGDGPVQQVRRELEAHAVPEAPAGRIAACVGQAEREGLPCEALACRVCEGLAKRVSPEALQAAVEARAARLREAHRLLGGAGCPACPRHGEGTRSLCCLLAQALESGVPPQVFSEILAKPDDASTVRLPALVEAGEMLHLAGLGAPEIQAFLREGRAGNWNRRETLDRARERVRRARAAASPPRGQPPP
jgi:hypothetical protein